MFPSLRFSSHSFLYKKTLILTQNTVCCQTYGSFSSPFLRDPRSFSFSLRWIDHIRRASTKSDNLSVKLKSPVSGLEDVLMGYVCGKRKVTEVAHLVWQHIVQKGDTVVDATCGNGYDTLTMLKMVADESGSGCVFGMDIQADAIDNTSSLLDGSLNLNERKLVKLFPICHSRMEEIVPKGTFVRLVAFNLGYLPGGDKEIITVSETTLLALHAASRLVGPGGLISITVYVGHPGGREELETVQTFASGLSVENWVCCKFEMVNRGLAPVLILLFKK